MENLNSTDAAALQQDDTNKISKPNDAQPDYGVDPTQLPDVIFVVQNELYSVSSRYVLHICVMPKITVMNGLEPYCRGITLFNEKSVPVYDLRKLFGLSSYEEEWTKMLQQRMADHRRWVTELENSVINETEFKLTTDPHQCAFGKWYDTFTTDNTYLNMYLKQINAPHTAIHKTGERIKQLMSEGKKHEAKEALDAMKKQHYSKTMELLENMSQVYMEGRREMLIIMLIEGTYISLVADSISAIKKLTEVFALPDDTPAAKEQFIEMLAKENKTSGVIQMLDPFALIGGESV